MHAGLDLDVCVCAWSVSRPRMHSHEIMDAMPRVQIVADRNQTVSNERVAHVPPLFASSSHEACP